MDEESLKQGMLVPIEGRKQKNTDFPLEAPERIYPCRGLDINLVRPIFVFLSFRNYEMRNLLF